jgi:hypothetical protein
MLPYLVFFGLFALGSLMTRPDLRSYKPVGPLLIAGAILVAVMIGLRDRVGVDWPIISRSGPPPAACRSGA